MCIRDSTHSAQDVQRHLFIDQRLGILQDDAHAAKVAVVPQHLFDPVSYTHLDVYKRQLQDIQGGGGLLCALFGLTAVGLGQTTDFQDLFSMISGHLAPSGPQNGSWRWGRPF